ncbi:hypothetical protein L195_g011983, partial [Trifolium pratense]
MCDTVFSVSVAAGGDRRERDNGVENETKRVMGEFRGVVSVSYKFT